MMTSADLAAWEQVRWAVSTRNAAWWTFGAACAGVTANFLVVLSAFYLQRRQYRDAVRLEATRLAEATSAAGAAMMTAVSQLDIYHQAAIAFGPENKDNFVDLRNFMSAGAEDLSLRRATIRDFLDRRLSNDKLVYALLATELVLGQAVAAMVKGGNVADMMGGPNSATQVLGNLTGRREWLIDQVNAALQRHSLS